MKIVLPAKAITKNVQIVKRITQTVTSVIKMASIMKVNALVAARIVLVVSIVVVASIEKKTKNQLKRMPQKPC